MTKVYNRKTLKIEEIKHIGEKPLNIIYKDKTLLKIATSKPISKVYEIYNNKKIHKTK